MTTKRQTKVKEPVKLRSKELKNGNKRLYLDIYRKGSRHYEFLKLYLVKGNTPEIRTRNEKSHLKPKLQREVREYLVVDELQRLIRTPCKKEELKRMFLFSCFTGLRASDVTGLRCGEIVEDDNGGLEVCKIMKKTSLRVTVPLSKPAMNFLPIKKEGTSQFDYVYSLRGIRNMTSHIVEWAKDAGIKKHVTFHVARHTFATLVLTQGADIYTVSKLLGHSDVSITQRCAKVIDKKKTEATHLLDDVL